MSVSSRWKTISLALALALTSCSDGEAPEGAPPPETIDPAAVAWVRDHAIPFRTTEPDGDPNDLDFLKEIIGDARIVALGEATHGTHEFFRMKHRLIQFLVREMEFDIVAFEAGGPEMNRLDDFIGTGEGDPKKQLAELGYWPWASREVLDLVLWLRDHNRSSTVLPKVRLRGLDMQIPGPAAEQLVEFFRRVDPSEAAAAEAVLACLRPFETSAELNALYGRYLKLPPETQAACRAGLQDLHDRLLEKRDALAQASSAEAFARALGCARLLVQLEQSLRHRSLRDRFMAENAEWLLAQAGPSAKMVIWSHNGHVNNLPGRMGRSLKRRFGERAVLGGFTFQRGTFRAVEQTEEEGYRSLRAFQAPDTPSGSFERIFGAAGIPLFLIDLRASRSAPPSWLAQPRSLRRIGASFCAGCAASSPWSLVTLPQEYDLLIFLEETTPSIPLH